MIRSMTGFTEKIFHSKTLSAKISLRTLNHRFFDWNFRGSQSMVLENKFRKICQEKISRGRIEVHVELDFLDSSKIDLVINEDVLSKILVSFQNVSSRTLKNVSLNIENLFNLPHVIQLRRKNFSKDDIFFLENCFVKTLDELIRGREREGWQLRKEIVGYLKNIKQVLNKMEVLAKKQPVQIQKKLKERLRELGHETKLSEEKMASEVAYYAQKYDLSEEIARLKCHLEHFNELLYSERPDPAGKSMDFLAQELFREANTINSKAQDMRIVKFGLVIKGDIESIRQQVQNLE
ncbi:MAG: YicC family protein [Candidatus Aminicenantes bacterium]|nr:YicC family protein [Candidatus Aminicenantes bacterium]